MPRRIAPFMVVFLALAGCAREASPEDEVRAVIAAAEAAAEERDASALFELVAPDYRDGRGNGEKEIRRLVRGYLITHQSIHLVTRVEEIEFPATDLARVRVTVGMLGQPAAGRSPWDLAADVYEFDLVLAREDGDWRLTRAGWRRGLAD
jgi:hypothetical protein